MSYEIYYDRAFIRVGESFIPLVNQGSSNCWEYSCFSKREIPEKNWQVLNWRHRAQLVFTADEIRRQAAIYEETSQQNGMCFKTRNTPFASGEFGRWILNGMKNSYTIEEYVSFGNAPFIHDYSDADPDKWKRYYFRTTEDFLDLLEQLQGSDRLSLGFDDKRNVHHPVKHRPKPKPTDYQALTEYFVLKFDLGYFSRWRKAGGFVYAFDATVKPTRKFLKEADAEKYLVKYQERFTRPFAVERIIPTA